MARMSRLPGRAIKHFGWAMQRHQLWMSEEYLLSREITLIQEDVRRYYYRDIQAIISTPTRTWITCSWLAGTLLVILAACGILAAVMGSPVAVALAAVSGAVPLAILLGNLILGPSCRTMLYTAATEATLHSLGRQRAADRAVALLLPFIEAAQRGVTPQGGAAAPSEAVENPASVWRAPDADGEHPAAVRPAYGPDPSDP